MSHSWRHGECAESLPQATRMRDECRDIPRNVSRHTAIATLSYLNSGIAPKSPSHGHASHANSRLPRARRTPLRWWECILRMLDRPMKKEMGQIDFLGRKNDKCEMGTVFAMRFAQPGAKSVHAITVGPSHVVRDVEDLADAPAGSWGKRRGQAGEAENHRLSHRFWRNQARRGAGPQSFAWGELTVV